MDDPTKQIPRRLLERVAAGELEDARIAELLSARGLTREELDAQLRELASSDAELLDAFPAQVMSKRIMNEYEARQRAAGLPHGVSTAGLERSRRRAQFAIGVTVLAASALAFFIIPRPATEPSTRDAPIGESIEITRLKGTNNARLQIWRRTSDEPERLKQGEVAREGDTLQLRYRSGAARFGAIASLDGRGATTLHFPASASDSTELEQGTVTLDYSYELDDAPEFEHFYFVTCTTPVNVAEFLEKVGDSKPTRDAKSSLEVGEGCEETTFHITKAPAR